MKILIVDDDAKICRMLSRRLKKQGYTLLIAGNGQEFLEVVREFDPDLTLLDMHMPVMDGYTAVRKLRASGYAGIIAALTASATKADIPKAMAAGCDYFLAKPIGIDFEETIAELLTRGGGNHVH